ncbi:MAG TPA: MATE family efflux transporter, partial [Clostridia bacterium]|nr:MATE family efflux transporter [Clostridia bacterium]
AMLGFGQGFQPVCGFNYGAKKHGRVWEAFWFCAQVSTVFLILAAIAGYAFAPMLIAVFRNDPEVIAVGTKAMRLMSFSYWLSGWIIMANMLMQTIGKYARASLLALARQGLFFIPAILVFPRLFGLLGVQMSQAVSDLLSFLLSIPVAYGVLREIKGEKDREEAEAAQPELCAAKENA